MGIVSELEGLLSVDSSDGIAWDRIEELLEPPLPGEADAVEWRCV